MKNEAGNYFKKAQTEKTKRLELSLTILMVAGAMVESEGHFFTTNTDHRVSAKGAIKNAEIACKEMRDRTIKNFPDFADMNFDRAACYSEILKKVATLEDDKLKLFIDHLKKFPK